MTTHACHLRRLAALSIAVAALEQAGAADTDDPISAHQFRSIVETARRIAARMNQRTDDLAATFPEEQPRLPGLRDHELDELCTSP